MRIFRATNPAVINYIKDKIRPADGVSKEQYLVNLEAWLLNAPDTLFVQTIFGDDSELLAFMICYLPPSVNFVFVSQVWSAEPKHAAMLLVRAIGWGDALGRSQIRLETESDHDKFGETWGFDTLTVTKGKNFADITTDWLASITREAKNAVPDHGTTEVQNVVASESADNGSEPVLARPEQPAADIQVPEPAAKGE